MTLLARPKIFLHETGFNKQHLCNILIEIKIQIHYLQPEEKSAQIKLITFLYSSCLSHLSVERSGIARNTVECDVERGEGAYTRMFMSDCYIWNR